MQTPLASLGDRYASSIQDNLRRIVEDEGNAVKEAARLILKARASGGIVHVFGAGHSQLVAADATYRAAGPAWVNGILDPSLSVQRGALASTAAEGIGENALPIFLQERVSPEDATVVVCNSGSTPVSVAWAKHCSKQGVPVISIVSKASMSYFGKRERPLISEFSDVLLDNHCPVGDAAIQERIEGIPVSLGPCSTIVNAFVLHWLFVHVLDESLRDGKEVQTFRSGHLEGAEEHNEVLMEQFRGRVRVF